MTQKRVLYRADMRLRTVVKTMGTEFPEKDNDGEKIFVNTHYENKNQAWKALQRNAIAGVNLAGDRVTEAKRSLVEANERAANAAEALAQVNANYNEAHRDKAVPS